jgi:hypothetical protein
MGSKLLHHVTIRFSALVAMVWLVAQPLEAATYTVCASGCDFATVQSAINAAARGDTLVLTAGETFTEAVTFPNKGAGTSHITITSSASAGNLPGSGVRTGPQYASFMPKIKSPGGGAAAFTVQTGANYLTIRHVEFPHVPGGIGDIFVCGSATISQSKLSDEPHDIVLDRVYIHGDEVAGQKRGIALNCRNFTMGSSYIDDIKGLGQDATAFGGWNTSGGHTITNTYIGAAAYGYLYGGGTVFMRLHTTVSASPTTTGATVTLDESGHNCNEVSSGQHVAIETSAGVLFSTLTSTPSSSSGPCALTWAAIATAPSVGHRVRLGTMPTNITITRNHIRKDPAWAQGPLARPTAPTATASTSSGSLAAGTYYYRVQARGVGVGYNFNTVVSDVSLESTASLSATGQIALDWPDITGETEWWVWRFTTAGTALGERTTVTGADAFTDDGTATWIVGSYPAGSRWVIKNAMELKMGVNVTISGNIIENFWRGVDSSPGGIWIKNADQDGQNWYVKTSNVTIENNKWITGCGWILIEGRKTAPGHTILPKQLNDVTIRNNLVIDNNNTACQTSQAWAILFADATTNITFDHNTVIYTMVNGNGLLELGANVANQTNLRFRSNMFTKGHYGIKSNVAFNKAALDGAAVGGAAGYTFSHNAIGYDPSAGTTWPSGNLLQTMTAWQNEFVSYSATATGGNFRLKASSPHNDAGHDGADIGADIDALETAIDGVDTGAPDTDPPTITTTVLPNSLEDISYGTQTVQRTGGTAPFTFSISSGALPTGLSINSSTGAITGTPTTAGVYAFTVKVVDDNAEEDTQDFTVTIYAAIAVTTTTLAGGSLDATYSATLEATGDQTPYAWAVTVGTLPTGLSLAADTGIISGTATVAGTANFTVRATGALGSQDTQALSIAIAAEETLPDGRPPGTGPLRQERSDFRRPTAPTCDDKPADGDQWADTSIEPAITRVASVTMSGSSCVSVEWTPMSSSTGALVGDGSQLTDLNASEITSGTIPADVLPSLFPSAVTFGTSVTTPTVVVDYVDHVLQTCTQLSSPGFARQCVDANNDAVLWSFNGGPYESGGSSMLIGGNAPLGALVFGTTNDHGVILRTNNLNHLVVTAGGNMYLETTGPADLAVKVETDVTSNLYGMGLATANGRKISLISDLGTLRSAMQFGDASASGDVVWGVSASVNSGSLWTPYLRVKNTGQVLMKHLQMETLAEPTCNAANRGSIVYVAGGAGVADTLRVCSKDASDNYAYRALY